MSKSLREVIHPALLNELAEIALALPKERHTVMVAAVNEIQKVIMAHELSLQEAIVTLVRTFDLALDQIDKADAEMELHSAKPANVN